MNIRDLYGSKAVAIVHNEAASNKIAYLGAGLFPADKKMGLDLKWIKTSNGLPVSLMPSNFDAVSTLRTREGFKMDETEMAFFRESILLKEADRQEILRVQEASDPYAQDVIKRVYNDAETLIEGAIVVPERMRMQLLTPPATGSAAGSPQISIQANGVTYAYNYDPTGDYAANNFMEITTNTLKWDDHANSDPISDIQAGIDKVEDKTGNKPELMLVSPATMKHLRLNDNIKAAVLAQNPTANVVMNDAKVKQVIKDILGIDIVVYGKKFKNEAGVAQQFFADGYATLIPSGALGKTWFGTTPEEADLLSKADVDVTIVETGVAVTVSTSNDPVQTKTTASEIVLPSYERMDETFVIKCY
ncbi:MAG: major capsid protein [Prevotellaceae bacterium]|nr:major capsid protein [Prevotellaceae bacterium]